MEPMKCPRCQGLLIRDQIWNPSEAVGVLSVERCVNCGEVVDGGILRNRDKSHHPAIERKHTAA